MSTLERHFSPQELAESWGISTTKVRRVFKDQSGVILIGSPSRRLGKKLRRSYYTMRIPESIAVKVYEGMKRK